MKEIMALFLELDHRMLKHVADRKRVSSGAVLPAEIYVSERQLEWCKAHRHWTLERKHTLWSDESHFTIWQSDGRIRVWQMPRERCSPLCIIPTVRFGGGGIMLWLFWSFNQFVLAPCCFSITWLLCIKCAFSLGGYDPLSFACCSFHHHHHPVFLKAS